MLSALGGLEHVPFASSPNDELDRTFQSSIPGFSRKWNSEVSRCPVSGSLIHFCSMDSNSTTAKDRNGPFSLLALTNSPSGTFAEESIQDFRKLLASHIKSRASIIKIKDSVGSAVAVGELLRSISTGGLPLLALPTRTEESIDKPENPITGLKEVVIPYFDYAAYADGSNLLSNIASAELKRPTVGVYQWTGCSTHVRPLPTAGEDQRLPPPSLIFQCRNPEEANVHELNVGTAKIGYTGNGTGQLMLIHEDLAGLDVRYCPRIGFSSAFSEAQDSLLAGSLHELQSTNTLLAGGENAKVDDRHGKADCWVEVRANLKRPIGFLQRSVTTSRASKHRVAKAPDIPYE